MAYPPLQDFDAFWNFASERANQSNDLSHHLCCDTWTTRTSKRSRATHSQETKWRSLLASLDSAAPDKKTALRAKMLEEGWRIPVSINKYCKTRPLHPTPLPPSDSSSDQYPPQPLPLHSGAFTYSQPTGLILPQQRTIENFQNRGFIESDKPLDTFSLKSFCLPSSSHTVSEE